jgi:signal transduction histidine kinase
MQTDGTHATPSHRSIAEDIEAIGRLDSVPTILQTVAHTTGMRFTAVARVTDTRWVACAVYDHVDFGLKPGSELVLESTICNEIRRHHRAVIFNEASKHPHFRDHPTPKLYGFESYVSIPIFRKNGDFFGTLCAIDPLPAKLDDPNVVKTLELFARLIGTELDAQDRLEESANALLDAQETAKLREQFIAVLGHDLRNPLMAIQSGADMLKRRVADARSQDIIEHIQRSSDRMAGLISDILDFARGRLGEGIPVVQQPQDRLADELRSVIAEVQQANPDRVMHATVAVDQPVWCDARRLAQLLVNLLVNAMVHGAADQPVRIAAQVDGDMFELCVSNSGLPIPQEKRARLFHPFTRGNDEESPSGLGLGLYIASEIARAHQGSLQVTSDERETCFAFRMPVRGTSSSMSGNDRNRDENSLAC